VLTRVDLPDVVRCRGATRIATGWSTGGCGGQARLAEPALDGPGTWHAVPHAAQVDAEVLGAPLGMSAPQIQSGTIEHPLSHIGLASRMAVIGGQSGIAALTEPVDQAADRSLGEAKFPGDLGDGLAVTPPPLNGGAERNRDWSRHGGSPMRQFIVLDEHHHKIPPSCGQT
jgi:hypothetical protein